MSRFRLVAPFALLLCASTAAADPLPSIEPGEWETSIEQSIDGVAQPVATNKVCVKDGDMEALMRKLGESLGNMCKFDTKVDGDVATTSISCKIGKEISVQGNQKVKFTRKSYTGKMKLTMQTSGDKKKQTIDGKSSGRWLGACKK